jgi:hypothetical protein
MRGIFKPGKESPLVNDPLGLLLALAYPAAFINFGNGHNGFLTAALFAGALAQLDRRPFIAGSLVGFLAYKPQSALLIPLVLAVSCRWSGFFAAVATIAALALAVTLAFDADVWAAFLASTKFSSSVALEQGGNAGTKSRASFLGCACGRLCTAHICGAGRSDPRLAVAHARINPAASRRAADRHRAGNAQPAQLRPCAVGAGHRVPFRRRRNARLRSMTQNIARRALAIASCSPLNRTGHAYSAGGAAHGVGAHRIAAPRHRRSRPRYCTAQSGRRIK